jgi:hypothetical protein
MQMEIALSPLPSNHAFVLAPNPDYVESQDNIILESYEDGIPDFLGGELGRLYRSIFSSLPQFRIHGGADQAITLVARTRTCILSVLIYRVEGRRVEVLNQCFVLQDEEITRFTRYIFERYPLVDSVSFRTVDNQMSSLPHPAQVYQCSEDFVLRLPDSVDAYHASLGKSTRQYVNRYLKKLKQLHPGFSFEALTGDDIREEDVHAIFDLNRARMGVRGTSYGFADDYPAKTTQLLKEVGLLCVLRIDGRVCAGTILYCVEGEYYLDVLSHDSMFNDIGLGTLCCYLSICECIRRNGRVYHFLWGRYDYKLRLGGIERPLSEVTLYRSRLPMVLRPVPVIKQAAKGQLYKMKMWLRQRSNTESAKPNHSVKPRDHS